MGNGQGNYSFPFTAPGQHSGAQSPAGGGGGVGMSMGAFGPIMAIGNWLQQDARWNKTMAAGQEGSFRVAAEYHVRDRGHACAF